MSWTTVIWSATATASLMLALVHLFIWFGGRRQMEHLALSVMAIGAAMIAVIEFPLMHAQTPAQYGQLARWFHVPVFILVVSLVWFARAYFHSGRLWLGGLAITLRAISLAINFALPVSLNYQRITSLKQVTFLGESVVSAVGVPSRWTLLPQASLLLVVIYLIDATVTVWRRGERQRAALVGGAMIIFAAQGLVQAVLIVWGLVEGPLRATPFYVLMLVVMAFELSRDMLRSSQLARKLRESEGQAELAAEAAGLGFWSWDAKSDQLWATQRTRDLFGWTHRGPLSLRHFLDVLHPDDREPTRQAISKAIAEAGEYESEYRVRLSDGKLRWIAARGSTERMDGRSDSILMRGVVMDITERKRAQERFRLMLEGSPNAILLVDTQGLIVLANERAEVLFGYMRQELIGQPIEMLVPESAREQHPNYREDFFKSPRARAMGVGRELSARRKNGTQFPVEVGLNPIQTEEGSFVLSAIVDISDRRRSELELAQMRENLSHIGRVSTMGQLASALAHEINQPLGAILRNAEAAELILNGKSPDLEELRAIITDIRRDDHRAGDVIDRLRGLLKRRDIEMLPLKVEPLLRETVALVRTSAAARQIRLEVEIAPQLPEVKGDRIQLQQVLLNLMINAMDAVDKQPPERRLIQVEAGRDASNLIEIAVRDFGDGIGAGELVHIFEPFFSTKLHGMGMGLPISLTIIKAHGGRIRAENNPDGGATFRFTLLTEAGQRDRDSSGSSGG